MEVKDAEEGTAGGRGGSGKNWSHVLSSSHGAQGKTGRSASTGVGLHISDSSFAAAGAGANSTGGGALNVLPLEKPHRVWLRSEFDLFSYLGLQFIPPTQRCCFSTTLAAEEAKAGAGGGRGGPKGGPSRPGDDSAASARGPPNKRARKSGAGAPDSP